jgi:uncharacterized protein (TIGR02118 family)
MTVKLVVIYPRPDDNEAFETVYNRDHVPMAVAKLAGKTKIVASKIVGSPQETPPFHRIAEIHFPSMEALQACGARRVANKRSLMQLRFLPAAHRSSWSRKRKYSCFKGSDLSAET